MVRIGLVLACLMAATTGGVFFAFSNFIMRALDRIGVAGATEAMRSINVVVITPAFMTLLFGTGVLAAVLAFLVTGPSNTVWAVRAGAAVYVIGCIGVTIAGNVPLNDALMAGKIDWTGYYQPWTMWNHVRTAACLVSAALIGWALVSSGPAAT